MSRNEKMKIIRLIEGADTSIFDASAKYDVPRSTYYRWKRNLKAIGTKGLENNKPHRARTWNQLLPHQVDNILEYATFYPELPCREISLHIADKDGFSVSESTVYRRLKERGLIRGRGSEPSRHLMNSASRPKDWGIYLPRLIISRRTARSNDTTAR